MFAQKREDINEIQNTFTYAELNQGPKPQMKRLAKRLKISSSATDAVIITIFTIAVLLIMSALDAHEKFDEYIRSHEKYQLDELLLTVMCAGAAGYIYALRRLQELKRETKARTIAETNATWISFHDFLTKLPNRRFLDEQAAVIVRDNFPDGYAVCAIDLDGFKKVNDLIGHDGGDSLLITIANRLSKAFADAIVIRLGGDEFLAITRSPEPEELRSLCVSVVKELSRPIDVAGIHAEVGACIGYATYPEDALSLKDLAMCADVALYAAKHRGRNSVAAYLPSMSETLAQRAEVEGKLRRAVREKTINPYYQPLIDLKTGHLRGFEALARWQIDENRFISPEDFIPMAEDIGLIVELSEQLLRQACLDAMTWPTDITLAFNISPTMMVDHLLGMRIVKVLGETGLNPHRLEIEITETALVRDIDLAAKVIGDLRIAGIKVALDDFGTGYSSLSQLSKFAFDKIKIDRSFIGELETDEKKMNIVRTMVALGKGLGIATTAEGIENPEQLDALKDLGCSFGQGFLFGKAVPADEALAFIRSEENRKSKEA
ncbi:putative bifunctional diguanylate cyclase/phosphodiesterase [Roseibium litorale]|uniref:EAL domain-containing protein n=1 Tax=Roseibium litorale TaxID=2803841 RepID=A0ABR9CQW9_9HYPH|nr:EAL domain-containing protein [Roseibium litorale]MBD8893054.1 EAL domain-containing protein [Roseibium litorale]